MDDRFEEYLNAAAADIPEMKAISRRTAEAVSTEEEAVVVLGKRVRRG